MSGLIGGALRIASGLSAISSLFGGAGAVQLDAVTLDGWEVPETIKWGGTQQVTVHKLTGGERVINAMGRDDMPLSWSGILQGSGATARGRLLDQLRIDGSEVELAWSDFDYSVVVTEFECDFTKPYWQPYRISCTVLRDEAQANHTVATSPIDSVLKDVGSAVGLPDLSAASISAQLAKVQKVAGVVTSLTGGNPAAVALLGNLTAVGGPITAGLGAANAGLGSIKSLGDLTAATANAGKLAGLSAAGAFIGRAVKTVAGA